MQYITLLGDFWHNFTKFPSPQVSVVGAGGHYESVLATFEKLKIMNIDLDFLFGHVCQALQAVFQLISIWATSNMFAIHKQLQVSLWHQQGPISSPNH